MKVGRLRAGARGVCAAALIGACAAALAAASAAPAAVERVGKGGGQPAAYWTEERMREARPAEELFGADSPRQAEPGVAEEVPGPAAPPYSAHGRVFFRHNKRDYYCSGTVANAATHKLVVTAAHCVYFKRRFASKWIFVPAYHEEGEKNPAPYGRWRARRLAVPNAWWRSARDLNPSNDDVRFDVGMVSVAPREGRAIQDVVGARRIVFNSGPVSSLEAVGYPATGPFDGSKMFHCVSPWQGRDQRAQRPRPIRIACDMTAGGSGGGILNANKRLISVISYSYCLDPAKACKRQEEGKLFGPQFGVAIRRLYRAESKPKRKRARRGKRPASRWARVR